MMPEDDMATMSEVRVAGAPRISPQYPTTIPIPLVPIVMTACAFTVTLAYWSVAVFVAVILAATSWGLWVHRAYVVTSNPSGQPRRWLAFLEKVRAYLADEDFEEVMPVRRDNSGSAS